MKKTITYLLYIIGLLLLIYYGNAYQVKLRIIFNQELNLMPMLLFNSAYSIIVGIYIALPSFIITILKSGKVHIDWLKILIIGIPTFLISASGVLYHYLRPTELITMFHWIFSRYSVSGTSLIAVVFGYTLLSSIVKEENDKIVYARKFSIAKIITLSIIATFFIYISFTGIIHPPKLVNVNANIETNDQKQGYSMEDGTEVKFILTEIVYTFEFENLPNSSLIGEAIRDNKVRVEPKDSLEKLFQDDIFNNPRGGGFGTSTSGNKTEISFYYNIGSIDPEGKFPNKYPPSQEELNMIENYLYDAVLVFEIKGKKTKRYDLTEFKNE
ncbi:hypothetical protein [Desulfuribacillus alkaliarsenatis]|uniref:Uncharacterized protein n=1 Tax=Desulfuribacillus alkaliarsenatis TaxID=766136 RepID=A0A1E5G3D7_9FIRM|nr:hypothetical protein [Desulfuribacillus alkaliarsenatis]OEF97587.1 hypothetical protein BHF68_14725 [Desulfuribacillus alkaliarsenatis]